MLPARLITRSDAHAGGKRERGGIKGEVIEASAKEQRKEGMERDSAHNSRR